MASKWATRIQTVLGLGPTATTFLSYNGQNDQSHIEKMHAIFNEDKLVSRSHKAIVKTASVVARLYLLQLEELNSRGSRDAANK